MTQRKKIANERIKYDLFFQITLYNGLLCSHKFIVAYFLSGHRMQTIFGCYGSGTAKEDLTNQHWNDRREIVGLDQGSAISSRAYFATSKLLYVSSHRRCRVSSRTRQRYFQTVEFFLTTGFRLSEQLIVSRLSTTCSRTGPRPLRLKLRKQLSFLFLPFSFFFHPSDLLSRSFACFFLERSLPAYEEIHLSSADGFRIKGEAFCCCCLFFRQKECYIK